MDTIIQLTPAQLLGYAGAIITISTALDYYEEQTEQFREVEGE